MDTLSTRVLEADEDYFGMPQTTDLVATADNFDNREYPLPSDTLNRIKRVEAKLDNATWVKLLSLDLSQYGKPTDETTVLQYFSNNEGEAFYDIFRNSLWIYSGAISASTGGLKLWTFTWPTAISDLSSTTDISADPSTTTHGFPRALHPILADLVVIDYKQAREKPIPLTEQERNIEKRTRDALASIKKIDKDNEVIGSLPSASMRGNEGEDY